MTILSRKELTSLVTHRADLCVSIFMPTHRAGRERRQDPIRLKNLLREVRGQVAGQGTSHDQVDELLRPIESSRQDDDFWESRQDGLAFFAARNFFRKYRLPVALPAEAQVSSRFHIRPLIRLLLGNSRFFILALSQDHAKLYEATRFSIRNLGLEDAMANTKAAERSREREPSLQFRTLGAPASGKGPALYHGHGGAVDATKQDIVKHFQAVDRGTTQILRGEDAPLVLACVGYLASIYESANSYSGLIRGKVPGSPEMWAEEELRDRAWELVSPVFNSRQDQALERLGEVSGTDRVLTGVREVVLAAAEGRIDTLFLEKNRHVWGNVDQDLRAVQIAPNADATSEDLLDFAAAHAMLHGGQVYSLDRGGLPTADSPVAALLRYAA